MAVERRELRERELERERERLRLRELYHSNGTFLIPITLLIAFISTALSARPANMR